MKKIWAIIFVLCIIAVLPVNAKKRQTEEIITSMTQLEKRQYQTRTYNSTDKKIVMKSILNTLQDEGYIVYNVNSLLGFIYGVKDFDTTDPNVDISKEFGLTKSRLNYNGVTVATLETCVNVTDFGENLRVRTNFKRKLLNQYGNAQFIDDVEDAEFYAEFYDKVDKAIELQKKVQTKIQPIDRQIPVPAPIKPRLEVKSVPATEKSQEVLTNELKIQTPQTQKQTETVLQEQKQDASKKEESVKNEEPKPAEVKKEVLQEIKIEQPKEELSEKDTIKQEKERLKALLKQTKEQAKIEEKNQKEQEKLAKEQERQAKKAEKQLIKSKKENKE